MIKYFTLALVFFLSFNFFAQSPKRVLKKIGDSPIFFIDSLNVDQSELAKYDAEEIAVVTVYKDKEAIEIMGEDGKDGVIFIETKKYAQQRYWNYFKSKSDEYAKIVPDLETDSTIQYILNERILKENFEGDLSSIDDSIFKGIEIIEKETLKTKYQVYDKDYGVIILSDKPENLYKARKKF